MNVAIVGDVHFHLRSHAEFEAQRFALLVTELIKAKHDIVVFAGDLLDHARPTLEEIKELNNQLQRLRDADINTFVTSGNHEAVSTSKSTYDYLDINAEYIKNTSLGGIDVVSWESIKAGDWEQESGILITHLRSDIGMIKEEYPIKELSDKYKTVFMGDIHQRYSPFDNVHYTSSPYSTKFLNKPIEGYGYIQFNSETKDWQYIDLDLPCKVKRTCEYKDIEKVLKGLEKHLVKLEVFGTSEELSNLTETPNVIYNKMVCIQADPTTTVKKSSDPLDGLEDLVLEVPVLKSYPKAEVKEKVNELKESK